MVNYNVRDIYNDEIKKVKNILKIKIHIIKKDDFRMVQKSSWKY